jgi:hypothetical protein
MTKARLAMLAAAFAREAVRPLQDAVDDLQKQLAIVAFKAAAIAPPAEEEQSGLTLH